MLVVVVIVTLSETRHQKITSVQRPLSPPVLLLLLLLLHLIHVTQPIQVAQVRHIVLSPISPRVLPVPPPETTASYHHSRHWLQRRATGTPAVVMTTCHVTGVYQVRAASSPWTVRDRTVDWDMRTHQRSQTPAVMDHSTTRLTATPPTYKYS